MREDLAETSITWGVGGPKLVFSGHRTMGIGNGIFVFLEASMPCGNTEDQAAGNERERERVREREIPEFPKPPRARAAVW